MSTVEPGRPPAAPEMERLRQAQERFMPMLLRIPGVHGVGIGYKRAAGRITDQLALVVHVDRKLPRNELDPREMVPAELRFFQDTTEEEVSVLTDVQERGRAVPYPHVADGSLEARVRPVPGGYSIGRVGSGGGTLGGWVWDDVNDQVVLLTNNHVLGSTAGADVLEPSQSDGGAFPADHFADVVRTGTLDATIAAPIRGGDVQLEIAGIGPAVYEIATATLDMQVEKSGQTTEHTTGRVVTVNLNKGHYGSTNDFEVDPDEGIDRFAYYGDSGSLIVERTHPSDRNWKRVVGLLWGGDPPLGNAYGHPITDVFADLNLKTVCAGVLEEILDSLFAESFEEFGERPVVREPVWVPPRRRASRLVRPRRLSWGISRDFERRLLGTARGKQIVEAVHAHRVDVVKLLRDRELFRVAAAATVPFVRGAWTTTEVLERTLDANDVARFQRALHSVEERYPELGGLLSLAADLLGQADGRKLSDLLVEQI